MNWKLAERIETIGTYLMALFYLAALVAIPAHGAGLISAKTGAILFLSGVLGTLPLMAIVCAASSWALNRRP